MRKKVLALVLALVMVVAMLPTVAFAAEASDAQALADALDPTHQKVEVNGDTVKLKESVEISTYIDIKGGNLTLDLGNYNITRTNGPTVFDVCAPNASLTIKGNGTISNKVAGDGKGANMILVSKAGASLTIEGNVTVKQNTEGCALSVTNGGQATLNGGNIVGYSNKEQDAVVSKPAVKIENSTFTMTAGKVTGEVQAMFNSSIVTINGGEIAGGKENGITASASTVNISGNAKVSGEESGVYVYAGSGKVTVSGNAEVNGRYGIVAANGGTANIEGGTVHGTTAGLGINGTDKSDSTAFNVTDGTVTGGVAGAYMPAGKLNVKGGTVKGKAGIVVRGGDVDVQGGTIEATGTATDKVTIGDAKVGGEPVQVPAAGITVDNAGYQAQAGGQKHVTIGDGATVKAAEGGATLAACNKGTAVEAQGGGKVKPEDNPFSVSGGTFTTGDGENKEQDAVNQFLVENYEYGDNGIEYKGENPEVTMDGVKYKTLKDALDHASQGSVIQLLEKNVTLPGEAGGDGRVEIKNKITIDLNGKTLSKAEAITDEATAGLKVVANGDLTITDTATKKGKITGKGTLLAAFGTGKITLDGCTIEQKDGTSDKNNAAVDTDGKGAAEITVKAGTTITANESGIGAHGAATVNIEGGTITAGVYGVVTNGSDDSKNTTVNITGGQITGKVAGMYLPSQNGKTTVTGDVTIEGTDGAGVVVRGGTITVEADKNGKAPTITAKGTNDQAYGDNVVTLPAAALVVDKNTAYGEVASAAISDGKFAAAAEQPSVFYAEDGKEPATETKPGVEISGGTYTSGGKNDLENIQSYLEPGLTTNDNGTVKADETKVVAVPDANNKTVDVASELKDGVVEVVVSGSVSASHSTASPSNTWWAGVGFVKPEGATKGSVKIDGKQDQEFKSLDNWKNGGETQSGLAFWFDASKITKKGITVELTWQTDDSTIGTTTYHITVAETLKVEPFKTEIVDFGYAAEKEAAKTAAAEGRKNANGASYDSKWIQNLDWIDQTMWITFKDPIPAGMTVIVPVTTPSGAVEDIECTGTGSAYTFAWSYKNTTQTGATSVEVGDYTINTTENPVTATQDGKAVDVVVTATATKATVEAGTVKVSIVGAGFKADAADAKTAIEATYEGVTGTAPDDKGNNWAGGDGDPNNGIEDAAPNTMWVTFRHVDEDGKTKEEAAQTYNVNIIKDDAQVYTEEVKGVKKGAVVYVSLNDKLTGQGAGEYVFQIVKDDVAVASQAVTVYEVKFDANGGKFTDDTTTVFAMAEDADSIAKPAVSAPEGKVFSSWDKSVDETTYIITYTAQYADPAPLVPGPTGTVTTPATVTMPAATNGSYTVSDRNAKAGDTVTITPKADEGYTVDTVVVTDKDGKDVTVTDNGDGTYTFTMPEKASQPVTVKVTFRKVAPSEKFTDVAQDAWYAEAINYVVEKGLMDGTGETTFAPNDPTNRAMLVTILYRLEGKPAVTKDIPFSDVASGEWYSDAINWAAANEIVDGYGDDTFRPTRELTREEAATILYRYAAYKEYDMTTTDDLTGYTDAETVSTWANTAMSWAVGTELINGMTTTTLVPSGGAIRAQIATILMRFCENIAK